MDAKQQKQGALPVSIISKKSYHSPKLSLLGDIRDLTLAPSPGITESGLGDGYRA